MSDKKIKFKEPRYIIPLITLPFVLVIYFLFGNTEKAEASPDTTAQQEGFNSELPLASDDIEELNRLEAYQNAIKTQRSTTGMGNIDSENYNNSLEEDPYSIKKRQDSLNKLFEENLKKRTKASEQAKRNRERLADLANGRKNDKPRAPSTKTKSSSSKTNDEMEAFKKQMRYLDSMQNPEKYEIAISDEDLTDPAYEISSGQAPENSYFNTIKPRKSKAMISAILDEGIKVWDGSRVRIRLLEPIIIDGNILDEGQYLYGLVSGFANQRVKINVTSVVINDVIYPLKISLYDNDGIEGIYIPHSSFRDFSKQLGSQSISGNYNANGDGPRNDSQLLYQSISNAVRSSTRAVRKAMRKNKARLKYNTEVYLVNKNLESN